MKSTAMLINTSRGSIIDEQALYRALKEKQIAEAALDVLENEPPASNNPLYIASISDIFPDKVWEDIY